ncbi:immunoglobulin superfamily member 2-like isoform X2 [Cyprinus carpio]|uniref:immunoglobulin superfamily member 2-like isoform X2 n=1 Tax=Cyprinus carpio TaxID=7962 RepID=UPI001C5933FE|nr:immunoglobulin superfamily member 2-like isoform X2 [Cyprinus carpio]
MREKAEGSIRLRMVDFWCRLWHLPLMLYLTGLLQFDLCSGQIQVQIQEGPLYRVKGYPMSISCNVTGFTGPPNWNFQFILKKPNVFLNIISTSDPDFAYRMFSGRISNKEIYIQRLSGSSVLLWIKNLQENDAGDLLCETLHTGGVYYGDYDDEAKLNVIADTLEALYSGSPSQSLSEGDPLQLECQVSSQTFQHTHLMVTWFLHGEEDENPRPIITLDRDLTVKPGAGFVDRYRAHLISMDKVEDTTYRLKMPQVQQSDQGKFFCKAIEWIQDPDYSWTQNAHKTTAACDVEIKRIGRGSPAVIIVTVLFIILIAVLAFYLYRCKKQHLGMSGLNNMDPESGSSEATLPCRTRLTAPKESIADKNWDQDSESENAGETHEGQKLLKESPQSAITEKNKDDTGNTNGELDKNEKNSENADEAEENANGKADETDTEADSQKSLQTQEEMEKSKILKNERKDEEESPEEQIETLREQDTKDADKNEREDEEETTKEKIETLGEKKKMRKTRHLK